MAARELSCRRRGNGGRSGDFGRRPRRRGFFTGRAKARGCSRIGRWTVSAIILGHALGVKGEGERLERRRWPRSRTFLTEKRAAAESVVWLGRPEKGVPEPPLILHGQAPAGRFEVAENSARVTGSSF